MRLTTKEQKDRAEVAEKGFVSTAEHYSINCRKGSKGDDKHRHIDYYMFIRGVLFGTVDIKARKKISASDCNVQDEFAWVEFLNIGGGYGWLKGEQDFVAFEREGDFVLILREKLCEMALDKCDITNMVKYPRDALYKGYRRKNRKDLSSLIKFDDVLKLDHLILSKQSQNKTVTE